MRRYGAFEVSRGVGTLYQQPVPPDELDDVQDVFTNVELPDEVMEEHGP